MKLNNLTKKLKNGLKVLGKKLDKHSPEILIGCGLVGFASTVVLVAKESPIAKERLEELHEHLAEVDEELSKPQIIFEEFKTVAPIYAPAAITGTVSVACILGSYKIGNKRTAALATAYELTQSRLIDYQDKVKETLGEKKEAKIRKDIAQDKVNSNPPAPEITGYGSEVVMTDGKSLFYDPYGGRYFRSSVEEVRRAEKIISDRLIQEMFVPLNDFYYEIGLSGTKAGDDVGFNVEDGIEILFNSCVAPDMTPCMVIEYYTKPSLEFRYY